MFEAEKLFNLLNCKLEEPQLKEPQKIDGRINFIQIHLLRNQQRKYLFEYGPGTTSLDFILTEDEAFKNLSDVINNFNHVKFHALFLPNSPAYESEILIFKNVFMRQISYYEVRIDEILIRLDVLIEKMDNTNV